MEEYKQALINAIEELKDANTSLARAKRKLLIRLLNELMAEQFTV